jgi:prepilin peptidase CpaA
MTLLTLITFGVGIAAVVEDLARRQISNWTSGAALALGLAVQASRDGWRGAMAAGEGATVGFAVFLIFYLLRGMGGGDVKLMAGFGSLVGPGTILSAAWIAAVAGGLMATGFVAVRAAWRRRGNVPREARRGADAIPYAPAIVAGVWLAELAMG